MTLPSSCKHITNSSSYGVQVQQNGVDGGYHGARCFGGVSRSAWAAAPPLSEVVQQLQALAAGKLLVGHGLAKDLSALGLKHPQHLMYDTMTHPAFCNRVRLRHTGVLHSTGCNLLCLVVSSGGNWAPQMALLVLRYRML